MLDALSVWPGKLFDTVQVPATAQNIQTFFQVPIGGVLVAGTGKTTAVTNMQRAGQLPAGAPPFRVRAIGVHATTALTLADSVLLMDNGALYVVIGTTEVYSGPLIVFPAGAGRWTSGSAAAAAETRDFGFPGGGPARMESELYIPNDVNFRVEFRWNGNIQLGVATNVTTTLHGVWETAWLKTQGA